MNLSELKQQAQKILDIKASEGYKLISFHKKSGGGVINNINLPEVSRTLQKEYKTQMNGWAYSCEVVIECKDTGCVDKENRKIYITPSDQVFVYAYRSGDAMNFDSGKFIDPELSIH